jgi:hypothetical protein
VGDRPVTPKQSAQTDMVAQAQTPEPALTSKTPIPVKNGTPIENILGGANGPELDDYLAAGYTEADVQKYEKFALGNIEDLQVPMKLTPDQMAQYAQQPGAEMAMPRETSLREGVQGAIYNTLDPSREPTGAIGDAISSALQSLIGQENLDDPSDVRAFAKLFTDFAGVTVPVYGGAETVDEGARTFNSGYKMISDGIASGDTNMIKIGAIDAAIGIGLTTLGVAEFVPLINGLTDPAKNLLREASPFAKNMLADAIGASRAIAQGDKDMLMEIFQPAGTPRSLGAAAPDPETAGAITAFHGSPYDFDAFDITKMGTGEGAQAYGPGLYFAENENVAREYRDSMLDARIPPLNDRLREVAREMSEISTGYRQWRSGQEERGRALAAEYDGLMDQRSSMRGRLYQVNIQANPEDFLNWDAPISQQSEKVRDALMPFVKRRIAQMGEAGNRFTTEQWMDRLRGGDVMLLDKVEDTPVSRALIEAGVPGVRYLDQSSRAAGEGTRNIVVFDDQLIDIVRKYGVAGLAIGAAVQSELGVNEQIEENT